MTISQAAAFAGVTVKTVRHYHRLGLVAEPRRDGSGYRRYDSADLLRLVQVRTLAQSGVPLAEVGALLDADADKFAAVLDDAEQRLTDRIDELIARRETLRQLANGDRALLSDRASALLRRLRSGEFTEHEVAVCREALVLVKALVPEGLDDYVSLIERSLDDPRYVALIRRGWRTVEWEAHDPRVDELAADVAEHLIANPTLLPVLTGLDARDDAAERYELLRRHRQDTDPAGARLTVLIERRLRSAGLDITPPTSAGPSSAALAHDRAEPTKSREDNR